MYLNKSKKIVIKIGSSLLMDEKGKPKKNWLKKFVQDIKLLLDKKKKYNNCVFWCYCIGLQLS